MVEHMTHRRRRALIVGQLERAFEPARVRRAADERTPDENMAKFQLPTSTKGGSKGFAPPRKTATKTAPPTRLPSAVGISFQSM